MHGGISTAFNIHRNGQKGKNNNNKTKQKEEKNVLGLTLQLEI